MENLQKEFKVLQPNTLIQELVAYIEEQLPDFIDSDEFKNNLTKKTNENQHSLAFCLFMTNLCKSKFNFQRENVQKGSFTIDIGVYAGANLILQLKRRNCQHHQVVILVKNMSMFMARELAFNVLKMGIMGLIITIVILMKMG